MEAKPGPKTIEVKEFCDCPFFYDDGVAEGCNVLGEEFGEGLIPKDDCPIKGGKAIIVWMQEPEAVEMFKDTPKDEEPTK